MLFSKLKEFDISILNKSKFKYYKIFYQLYLHEYDISITIFTDRSKIIFGCTDVNVIKANDKLYFKRHLDTFSTEINIKDVSKDQLFNESMTKELYDLDIECINKIKLIEKCIRELLEI